MRKDFNVIRCNLEKLNYKVNCFDTKESASAYLNSQLDNTTIGIGGSATAREMGLYESLSAHNEVYCHWALPEEMTVPQILKKAADTDYYISSVNGIAETGEIIEIDNTGNRVASICYGHKKVYLLVGENKIEDTFEKALWRARNIASPLNAKRYGLPTPCTGSENTCYNCRRPERLCNALLVLWNKPRSCEVEIILIHEDLGF